jgi:predicted NBD/HSP70 family sugar kinase
VAKDGSSRGPGAPKGSREGSRRTVLDALLRNGPVRVADLKGIVSPATFKRLATELEPAGWLVREDRGWAFGPSCGTVLALGVARERVRGALADAHGHLLATHTADVALRRRKGPPMAPDAYGAAISALVMKLLDDAPRNAGARVRGCVVAWPAPITLDGQVVMREPQTKAWLATNVLELLRSAILGDVTQAAARMPVELMNDADAQALGELNHGVARGARHLILIKVCGGIGGSVVIDGQLHRGARGEAGELGHVPVSVTGFKRSPPALAPFSKLPSCSCGADNHVERFASAAAIIDRVFTADDAASYNELCVQLLKLARHQAPARAALREAGLVIGQALLPSALLLDPDLVLITAEPHSEYLLSGARAAFSDDYAVERVRLGTPPPEGDWMMVRGAVHHARDSYLVGRLERAFGGAAGGR